MAENQPLYVLSLRDLRIASLTGHVVIIKAQTPTRIPEALRYEAYALGCVECDARGKIGGNDDAPPDEEDKGLSLQDVLYQMYVDGGVEHLDAGGLPKVAAVNELLGPGHARVSKKEIIPIWMKIQEEEKVYDEEGVPREER